MLEWKNYLGLELECSQHCAPNHGPLKMAKHILEGLKLQHHMPLKSQHSLEKSITPTHGVKIQHAYNDDDEQLELP